MWRRTAVANCAFNPTGLNLRFVNGISLVLSGATLDADGVANVTSITRPHERKSHGRQTAEDLTPLSPRSRNRHRHRRCGATCSASAA